MSTNWMASLSKIQPDAGTGAQRAGQPGMGGGNIPYAPGMTQLTPPSAQVPTQTNQPQSPPQGGPGGMNAQGSQPAQPQGPTQGMGAMPDFQRVLMVSNYLMERLKRQIAMAGVDRRG